MKRIIRNIRLYRYVIVGKTIDMIKFVMEGILFLVLFIVWSGVEYLYCGYFC